MKNIKTICWIAAAVLFLFLLKHLVWLWLFPRYEFVEITSTRPEPVRNIVVSMGDPKLDIRSTELRAGQTIKAKFDFWKNEHRIDGCFMVKADTSAQQSKPFSTGWGYFSNGMLLGYEVARIEFRPDTTILETEILDGIFF